MKWPNENRWTDLIIAQAQANGLDPNLVRGLVGHESAFQADSIGDDGASIGLMQIQLKTAQGLGFTGTAQGLTDPETNLTWGCQYLAQQITTAGAVDAGLSAYNGGYRPSLGFGARLPSGGFRNQAYVDAVLANTAYFQATYGTPNDPTNPGIQEAGITSGAEILILIGAAVIAALGWWFSR
jgi:soluble lytic murein transglycosylase-like protein